MNTYTKCTDCNQISIISSVHSDFSDTIIEGKCRDCQSEIADAKRELKALRA